jgi:hypothetical protein
MGLLKTYNAGEVAIIVGTRSIDGLAEDTFINATRDEQIFTKQVGAVGEVTRSDTNNKSGSITLTLQQTSDSNDFLTSVAAAKSVFPVIITDLSGRTVLRATQSWIQKYPDVEYGRDSGTREWVLDCADLELDVAGN